MEAEIQSSPEDETPWGFIEEGVFVEVPKLPMELAGMGPPPFEVRLPMGQIRKIILRPEVA